MFRVPVKRTLLGSLTAAALAALLVLAAPALSLRPYVAPPENFEVAGDPAAVSSARTGGDAVSRVVRAPKRFNLVGLRWTGAGEVELDIRTRAATGRWSAWKRVDAEAHDGPDPGRGERSGGVSAPVWAGEADAVQYRSSRRLRGVKLHFVNTTGTATRAGRVRTALRRGVSSGVVAASNLVTARAQTSRPEMVSRSAWGADRYCTPRRSPGYGEVRAGFVHHTVSTNDYTAEQGPAAVLAICQYHRNSNGWDDVGYNFLVDKYGRLYEGRAGGVDQAVIGAQAQGFNAQTTGISNIGTHTSVPQSDAALDAMARLIRWKFEVHGIPVSGSVPLTSAGGSSNRFPAGTSVSMQRISGHRDGNNTACPGAALYAQLDDLRSRAGAPSAPSGPKASIKLSKPRNPATLSRVLNFRGRITPGKRLVYIAVDRKVRGKYRRLATLRADASGETFRRGLRMKKTGTHRVWAAFGGDSVHPRTRTPKYRFVVMKPTGGVPASR